MNETTSGAELETPFEYDPAYLNSLRELYVMVGIWAVSLLWTLGYCALFAYQSPDATEAVSIVWGVPSWVLWGIAVPWGMGGLVTMWFALFFIKEDDTDLLAAEALLEKEFKKQQEGASA